MAEVLVGYDNTSDPSRRMPRADTAAVLDAYQAHLGSWAFKFARTKRLPFWPAGSKKSESQLGSSSASSPSPCKWSHKINSFLARSLSAGTLRANTLEYRVHLSDKLVLGVRIVLSTCKPAMCANSFFATAVNSPPKKVLFEVLVIFDRRHGLECFGNLDRPICVKKAQRS